MHDQDTINQFIELRARSVPYAQIAEHLKVSRCTLIAWGQKYRTEIDSLRSVEAEAIRAKHLGTRQQEVSILAQRLRRLEAAFDEHRPICIPIRQLTDMIRVTRNRLDELCAEPVVPETPAAEQAPPPALQPMKPMKQN
jgi:hypothetical protein